MGKCLFIIFILFPSSWAFTQSLNNNISLTYSKMYYPNWKGSAPTAGINYSLYFSDNFLFEVSLNKTYAVSNINFFPEIIPPEGIYYNDIFIRNLFNADVSIGYNILKIADNKIRLTGTAGISYVKGTEEIIVVVWPFEGITEYNYRKQFGINSGVNILYYPIKHIGIGIFSKARVYTKFDPDISFGASLNYRFGKKGDG